MGRAHEDAIHRARLDAQCAKHALRIIDRETGDPKSLARGHALFADVNAIDGTGLRTLITSDAGRQVVAMEAAITRRRQERAIRDIRTSR